MIIAVNEVYRSDPSDGQPEMIVGEAMGRFHVQLRTSDFDVRYRDGKAEVTLTRWHITPSGLKAMAQALTLAAAAAEAQVGLECAVLHVTG